MVNTITTLTKEKAWELLGTVPDPDIPVISITELGIVRDINVTPEGVVIVTLTPSYSGCPAMNVFKESIREVLFSNGATDVEIQISLTPAWTTDWLTPATKEKLKQYGIAPPEETCDTVTKLFTEGVKKITCPHCGQKHTRRISQFGSTPCKALWYCDNCLQPFEYFKCY